VSGPQISWVDSVIDDEAHPQPIFAEDFILNTIKAGRLKEWVEDVRSGKRIKKTLPAVMPAGTFSARGDENLTQHSGLCIADLDGLGEELLSVRKKLESSNHAYAVFVSAGGNGLKAVFRVPADAAQHAAGFRAVEKHVRELTGKQIDKSGRNPERLCFISYDPETYFNPGAHELLPLPEPEKPKLAVVANLNLSERQRIAGGLVGMINWLSAAEGFCVCPGKHLHTEDDRERDCKVYLDGRNGSHEPTIFCFHSSCRPIVEGINYALRSKIGKAEYAKPKEKEKVEQNGEAIKRGYKLLDLTTIKPQSVEWIEEPYLARGELIFLQGRGGVYKGTLALTWVAEATRGGEHCLLVSSGDSVEKKILPTLMAAGANMALVHPLVVQAQDFEDSLVLPSDVEELERAIVDTGSTLVVIDPLVSHVAGNVDSHRDHDVKRVLTKVSKVAQRTNATILCVHHTNKNASASAKEKGQGSTAFGTTARIVLGMEKLSETEAVLEVVKSNIGKEGERQKLTADLVVVATTPKIVKSPRLTRSGDSSVGYEEAVAGQKKEDTSKIDRAGILMLDILDEEGPQDQRALFDRVAKETTLTPATVRRHVYWGFWLRRT
jgi:hypothetical protein